MTDVSEWVTGKEIGAASAINLSSLTFQLRDYLKVGLVAARAKVATLHPHSGRFEPRPKPRIEEDWPVPQSLWATESGNSLFRLNAGTFKTNNTGIRGIGSVELIGLSYNRTEVWSALEIEDKAVRSVDLAKKSNAGAKLDKERWAAFAANLAVAVYCGEVLPGTVSQAAIYKAVTHRMAEGGDDNPLSLDTVRSAITMFQSLGTAD